MRKSLFLVMLALLALAMPLLAQEATPEAAPGSDMATGDDMGAMISDPAVQVMNQAVLNGMVTVTRAELPAAGFVVIHSDMDGMPGHVVGVSPVPEGVTENLSIMIDGAMATPMLHARLHIDDNTAGVFEHTDDPAADAPISGNHTAFMIAGIFAFDQQPIENTVIIASTILQEGGWLVVHADENGSPGAVLGQALVNPGTTPAVIVPLTAEGQTPVLWAMLHVDDNTVGTYEFGQVEGADNPVVIEGQVATRPMNVTDSPTIMLADGTMLESTSATPMIIPGMNQMLDTMQPASGELLIDMVTSVGPGFVDVHADMGGHPAVSLGVTPINDVESMGVVVALSPPPAMPDFPVTPMVWPMLHADTNANGVYEYLRVVGQDLPVIYNGAVVTVPTMVGDPATMDMSGEGMGDMATPEATPSG